MSASDLIRCVLLRVGLIAMGGWWSWPAAAAERDDGAQGISERLKAVESAIAAIQQREARQWIDEQRAADIDALARQFIADATTRSSYRTDAANFGYRGGFFIADPDGRFQLRISGFTQVRHVFNHQRGGIGDQDVAGFDLRRARIRFDGHVLDERIGYAISGSFDRGGMGALELSDAFLRFEADDSLEFRVGRFRPAMLREDALSAKRLPMLERSLVRAAFGEDRRAGIELRWAGDALRASAGWFDDTAGFVDANSWRARGRLEWLAAGSWRNARDATGFRGDSSSLMFGAGIGYADGKELPGSGMPESNTFTWTADVNWRSDGWSALAAVAGSNVETDGAADQRAIGIVVQGGVFICDHTELVGRYEWGDADDGSDELSAMTFGVNQYFAGHNLKFGIDIMYAFTPVGPFWASGGAGVRADIAGDHGQVVFRSQFQIVY